MKPLPPSHPSRCLLFLLIAIPFVVVAYQGMPWGGQLGAKARALAVALNLVIVSERLLKREGRSLADLGLGKPADALHKLAAAFADWLSAAMPCPILPARLSGVRSLSSLFCSPYSICYADGRDK